MKTLNFTASGSLQKGYIDKKITESKYSILIGVIIFAIIGVGFYLKLGNISLVIVNLIVISLPIGIYIYMSTYKQGVNVNTIISSIIVCDNEYQIFSYSFEAFFFKARAINVVAGKDKIHIEKVEFPYNEDGLDNDKKETLCLIIDERRYYLLYKYFPSLLMSEFQL